MAEHESIVKDGVVSWPDAKEVHGRICDLLQAKGTEHETKGTRMTGPSVCEGSARKGGLNEAPAREKPRVVPAPQRRAFEPGAHGDIYVNPPPAGPRPVSYRLQKGGVGENPEPKGKYPFPVRPDDSDEVKAAPGTQERSALVIKIDVGVDDAVKKLKSIQREARKAAQALRELGEAANAHVIVEVKSPEVDREAVARVVQEAFRDGRSFRVPFEVKSSAGDSVSGRPSDVLREPALTPTALSKTGAPRENV